MNKAEAERAVLLRNDGVCEIVCIPYHRPPFESILTIEGRTGDIKNISSKDVLYYEETDQNKGSIFE